MGYRFSGRRDDAEDAAQEALARAFQRWDRLRGQPCIAGWILTTTLNILRRKRPIDLRIQDEADPATDIDSSLDLWTAVRRLPKRQAQAVVLHYLADLPIVDVARVMDAARGTAKAHPRSSEETSRGGWMERSPGGAGRDDDAV